jgi:hypothetical protein
MADLIFGPDDWMTLDVAHPGLRDRGVLWVDFGDWGFTLDRPTVDKITDLLTGLEREAFFAPQIFQLDAEEGLSALIGVDRNGVQFDLYQHGEHTGCGVTIPHSWVLRVASTMQGLAAEAQS